MKIVLLLILTSFSCSAEKALHVLALDVDQRLVKPLLQHSLGGDVQKLSETIHKVQALSGKQGVHHLLNVELMPVGLGEDFKTVRDEKLEDRIKVLGTPLFRLGYELEWSQLRGAKSTYRELKITKPMARALKKKEKSRCRYHFVLRHRLSTEWALSALVKSERGAIFVFEKWQASHLDRPAGGYVVTAVSDQQGSRRLKEPPEEWVLKSTPGSAAVLLVPGPGYLGSLVNVEKQTRIRFQDRYEKSTNSFSVVTPAGAAAKAGGTFTINRIESHSAGQLIKHEGRHSMQYGDAEQGKEESFEVNVWKSIKIPKGTQSAVQKGKKPRYYARAYFQPAE